MRHARRVIMLNNRELIGRFGPVRLARELRWAWLLEGGARWFAGQTEFARPAIARRLHEGGRPSFPPGLRDAALADFRKALQLDPTLYSAKDALRRLGANP